MSAVKTQQRHYGPPKRSSPKQYSPYLECLENYKNRMVANEYLSTITQHLRDLEARSMVNPAMIDLQPEVKWFMRPYLVNFIVQMHSSLKLKPHTLFICWNIIDRYCAKRIAFKQHYQLIGCTALWIASKYEDKKSRVPSISELSVMCSNVYEESMFREMEVHILSTLGWSVGHASLEEILQLCVKYADPDAKETLNRPMEEYRGNSQTVSAILAVARYLCELSLYKRNYLTYPTSLVAVTAFLFSCSMLGLDCGSKCLNAIYHEYRLNNTTKVHPRGSCSGAARLNALSEQLPTPITPKKEFQFFDDDNECEYDSDAENKDPTDECMYGPFIGGFEGLESLNQIRQVSILMLQSLLNPSEVLVEKYTTLGVIAVVKNFVTKNHLRDLDLKDLTSVGQQAAADGMSDTVFDLSNLLLNFDSNLEFVTEQAMHFISPVYHSPGSASKSSNCSPSKSSYSPTYSPSNFSSFSSASSATTYDSCYEDVHTKATADDNMRDIKRVNYPDSSPIIN